MRKRPVVVLASKKPGLKSQCNLTITFKYTSTQTGGRQCGQFLIRAQICKNTGGTRADFLQKYECHTGKNTSADSQIFNFLKNGKTYFFNNAITQANLLFHSLFKNRKVNFQSAKMIILWCLLIPPLTYAPQLCWIRKRPEPSQLFMFFLLNSSGSHLDENVLFL